MIRQVPTNIITGFLGVGKSTAILHLLKAKPAQQRWAVLVNEFGEVGIDGEWLSGAQGQEAGVFIREVPGGCMCCTAGLPMQIALNRLLTQAQPDRLLIEPTGLGHPKEVLGVLAAEHYRSVLDLRATVTLVDARKVQDTRYTGHETFNQQLAVADIVVANKADQYADADLEGLSGYLGTIEGLSDKPLHAVEYGRISVAWLDQPCSATLQASPGAVSHGHGHGDLLDAPEIPECGYLKIDNQGEGFFSTGWRFKPEWAFDRQRLFALLNGVDVERLKAIFITQDGVFAYNLVDGILTEMVLDDAMDSRIELIGVKQERWDALECELLACVDRS